MNKQKRKPMTKLSSEEISEISNRISSEAYFFIVKEFKKEIEKIKEIRNDQFSYLLFGTCSKIAANIIFSLYRTYVENEIETSLNEIIELYKKSVDHYVGEIKSNKAKKYKDDEIKIGH